MEQYVWLKALKYRTQKSWLFLLNLVFGCPIFWSSLYLRYLWVSSIERTISWGKCTLNWVWLQRSLKHGKHLHNFCAPYKVWISSQLTSNKPFCYVTNKSFTLLYWNLTQVFSISCTRRVVRRVCLDLDSFIGIRSNLCTCKAFPQFNWH